VTEASDGSGSVAFDRAASYYDATRVVTEEATRRQTELLAGEIGARRALEIGCGTGQVSLPLRAAGVDVVGIDLSLPMLERLVEKSGGRPAFPVVQADAIRLPFGDAVFGAAVLRWVLHLIPPWRRAVAEIVRVLAPGGTILVNHGGFSGVGIEMRHTMQELLGRRLPAAGLDWHSPSELEQELSRVGATHHELPRYVEHTDEPLAVSVEGIEEGRFSWLWDLGEDERRAAARQLRRWAEERYGALDAPHPHDTEVVWHAYDLPTDGRAAPPAP
jgi:ubiquinone/menaquinone biosynthesis C-methylase UbiE